MVAIRLKGTAEEKADQLLTHLFVVAGERLRSEDGIHYGCPVHMTEELRHMVSMAAQSIAEAGMGGDEHMMADYAAISARLNLFAASLKPNPVIN